MAWRGGKSIRSETAILDFHRRTEECSSRRRNLVSEHMQLRDNQRISFEDLQR